MSEAEEFLEETVKVICRREDGCRRLVHRYGERDPQFVPAQPAGVR
jgi:hypothetical protein